MQEKNEISEQLCVYYQNLQNLINECETYSFVMQIDKETVEISYMLDRLSKKQQMEIAFDIETLINPEKILCSIYLYSFLMAQTRSEVFMEKLLCFILEKADWNPNSSYFLFCQCLTACERYPELYSKVNKVLLWKIFKNTINQFQKAVSFSGNWIEKQDRNPELVIVITGQLIGNHHGPTQTALDRCKTLMQHMKKKLLLINTAEVLSHVGKIPFFSLWQPAYEEEKSSLDYIGWKGSRIPFVQCENNMPDVETLSLLLQKIVELKPAFLVEIGTTSILANLASAYLPVLSVVTGFSRLAVTETQYQTSALKIEEEEKWILEQVQKDTTHIIPSTFTFGIRKQQIHLERRQVGLPEEQFLCAVVGLRLDNEINKEFVNMMLSTNAKTGFVFMGNFQFEQFMKSYPGLKGKAYFLGAVEEILACLELCDLFVNPIRLGGGTSAVEAMYKELPIVTTSYGDIGITAGEDFCVIDYEQMAEQIERYRTDREFYRIQSEKAQKRAAALLDTDRQFQVVIEEFEKRMIKNEKLFNIS